MIEIIDIDNNHKFMCLIICGVQYGDSVYVIYSIKRDAVDDNIFVSRVVRNSEGYVMDNHFSSGEKEVMEEVVCSIFNKESVNILRDKGIFLISDIKLVGINKFSVSECYVATYKRSFIQECMVNYKLLSTLDKKVVVQEKEVSYFSRGNISTFALIVFGIVILGFCLIILFQVFFR